MSRDGAGTYSLTAGQPVAINTVIDETVFNTLMTDVALALTNSIAANGETPTTAAIPFTEGITIPTAKAVTGAGTASVIGFQMVSGTVVRPGFATTATAAGTTTLTAASAQIQEFTGATTQTIVLPDVTTLTAGHHYDIINNSTGALTINSSGGNLVQTVNAGARATITCILASGTTAASWAVGFSLATTAAGAVSTNGASLTAGAISGTTAGFSGIVTHNNTTASLFSNRSAIVIQERTVVTTATSIANSVIAGVNNTGVLTIVSGFETSANTKTFSDLVLWQAGGSSPVTPISQQSVNAPQTRTYTVSGANLQVAMGASTSYTVSTTNLAQSN